MQKTRMKIKENHISNVEDSSNVVDTSNASTQNQTEQRLKNFIPASVNPDNNAFFGELSNPLSSKGD